MAVTSPLAAVDVGSNTIHLVVARPTDDGRGLVTLADELDMTRLGADVSAHGALSPERMARAIAVLKDQQARANSLGAAELLLIGTEAVRKAANADEFLARIQSELGVTLRLVSGEQEAALTYWGATSGLSSADDERRAVLDLGGGSMEVVVGEGSRILWRVSLPLGSGAMHDRYAPSDPPQAAELERVRQETAAQLAGSHPPLPVARAIACGGTATNLAALAASALDIPEPAGMGSSGATADTDTGQPGLLTKDQLETLASLLSKTPAAELTQRYGIMDARARLLGAGEAVLNAAARQLGVDALAISRRGVREGTILARLHAGDGWLDAAAKGAGWGDGSQAGD
jgi:exopolyphosphatase/guanosine-5'-triphosphate,3'-diphosphate pyrophosphatase